MLKILLATLLLTANSDIELKAPIEWSLTIRITDELIIKSYYANLNPELVDEIVYAYAITMGEFAKFNKAKCEIKPLEIRIINEEQMNSALYFEYVDTAPIIYGRYFRENQHMYITLEAAHNDEYFAHEMTHYLYDTCKIKFKNANIEHRAMRKFLKYLDRK